MSGAWVVVAREDRDVEELPDARSVVAVCPACGRRARLVERALVKNLRVLGVPLIATEPAARVFQCPSCEALCAREGEDLGAGAPGVAEADEARVEALTERVLKAEDEVLLWTQRAAVAAEKGDPALAQEARAQAERSARAALLLRREIAALVGVRPNVSAADETAQGRPSGELPTEAVTSPAAKEAPTEAPKPEPAPEPSLDDELAALRAKVAEKKRPKPQAEAPSVDDEVAALKAKLGRVAPPEAPAAGEGPETPAPETSSPERSDGAGEGDDEFASLKRKLRQKD